MRQELHLKTFVQHSGTRTQLLFFLSYDHLHVCIHHHSLAVYGKQAENTWMKKAEKCFTSLKFPPQGRTLYREQQKLEGRKRWPNEEAALRSKRLFSFPPHKGQQQPKPQSTNSSIISILDTNPLITL